MLYYKFNYLGFDHLQMRKKSTLIVENWWVEMWYARSPAIDQPSIVTVRNAPAAIGNVVRDLRGSCWRG